MLGFVAPLRGHLGSVEGRFRFYIHELCVLHESEVDQVLWLVVLSTAHVSLSLPYARVSSTEYGTTGSTVTCLEQLAALTFISCLF